MDSRTNAVFDSRHYRHQIFLDSRLLGTVFEFVEDMVVRGGGQHPGLFDLALGELDQELYVLGRGPCPGGDLWVFISPFQQLFQNPLVTLLVDEDLQIFYTTGSIVQFVEQIVVAELGLVGKQGEAGILGSIPQGGIGNSLGVAPGRLGGNGGGPFRIQDDRREITFVIVVNALGIYSLFPHHFTLLTTRACSLPVQGLCG